MEHIGIDLGTGSVKVIVISENGKTREAGAPYPIISRELGYSETPTEEWLRALRESIAALVPFDDELTIGFCGQMHGMVPAAGGRALYPAILWSDTRAGAFLKRIPSDPDFLAGIMNTPSLGMGLLSLPWLRENEPAVYSSAEYFLTPKDFIRYYLTGQALTDPSDAGATLLFDQRNGKWFSALLDAVGIDLSRLPPVVNSFELAAPLLPERAKELGLPISAVLRVGGADTANSLLGNGIDSSDVLQLSIGTGAQVAQYRDELPEFSPLLNCYPAVGRGWYVMSAHLNGGTFLEWLREILRFDWKDVYSELDSQPLKKWIEDIGGLIFHPYINGERTPFMNPALTGDLLGLRAGHKRIHIILAAMLGTLFAVRLGMESFADLPVIATGGSFKYPFWSRMSATALQRNLSIAERTSASAFGAALVGSGMDSDFYKKYFGRATGKQVAPDPDALPGIERLYSAFRESLSL